MKWKRLFITRGPLIPARKPNVSLREKGKVIVGPKRMHVLSTTADTGLMEATEKKHLRDHAKIRRELCSSIGASSLDLSSK